MPNYICTTCGVQYANGDSSPEGCPICEDSRQYVNWKGQEWITLEQLRAEHSNVIQPVDTNLTGIGTEPKFAIGQRALLVQTPQGNVLWDCISLVDSATVEAIAAKGGISAIAISHPHFYAAMVEWSHAFDGAPIYIHAADRGWVMCPDPAIVFWEGKTHQLNEDITLICCGGHFAGGTVLHWASGADGRGVLLTGDIIQVIPDRRYVSFMYSYPNLIPMSPEAVSGIVEAVEPFFYDRIHGGWWEYRVLEDAKASVAHSAARYIGAIKGEWSPARAP
ncbi:MAG: hypothetical protein JO235_13835 [Chroococcidiopsidaceae cyanobacterium CP_BM_RX_35]|nr:hypothetical protein [Chroococcidiopsidaceae cyanobacterium CP_BM_RX_35]